jgi:phosphatidylglycerophosphate synthase
MSTACHDGPAARVRVVTMPNLITLSRLGVVPGILAAAALQRPPVFLGLSSYALVSDVVDGRLARARHQQTAFGARLDSTADCALYLTAPLATCLAFPWLQAWPAIAAIYAGYLGPIAYGALKYHRLTAYHTRGARVAAVLLVLAFVAALAGHVAWPLDLAAGVLLASAVEEMLITRMLPAWRPDVPSVRAARRMRDTYTPSTSGVP